MTPAQFEEALRRGGEATLQALASANESQRRAAAAVALRWHKLLHKVPYGQSVEGVSYQELWRIVPLALLGTATLSEIRRARCRVSPDEESFRVLEQRRPDWLQNWAPWVLEVQPGSWPLIRKLIQCQLLSKPDAPSYTLALILGSQRRPVLTMLEDDPDLLEDVWRLFEIEGMGESSLAAFDKYVAQASTWNHALLTLCQREKLPRPRLLDASLQALARDFDAFRAGWFSRFHEDLQPTPAERGQRLSLYLGLLGSRVRPTVSFAVKALTQIQASIPAHDLLAHLAPALHASEKGTVLGALKLLRQVVKEPSQALTDLLQEALQHPSPEVQKALLLALQGYFPVPPVSFCQNLPEVASSLRPQLEKWLAISAPVEPNACADFQSLQPPAEPYRTLVEWDAALDNWRRGQEPRPLDLLDTPRSPTRVEPIQRLDDLVQLYATVLESGGPPIDVERVLDGVSRLCAERPPEFARLTGPLLKRAKQRLKKGRLLFVGHPPDDLAALALAWLEGQLLSSHPQRPLSIGVLLGDRVAELARRVARGESRALQSLPDHPAGWIIRPPDPHPGGDPLDLAVARLRRDNSLHRLDKSITRNEWGRAAWNQTALVQVNLHTQRERQSEPSLENPATLYAPDGDQQASDLRWQSTVWPAGRCHWWAQGLVQMINNVDWWAAEWGNRVYLESLLDAEVGLDEVALKLLAVGLSAKQPAESGLAVDAANLALEDGRLSGKRLGESLAAMGEYARPQRLAKTLGQLGALHPYPTFCALEELLAACPIEQAPLLELVHELGAQIQLAVRAPLARQHLESLRGGSKAAKLARQCLALTSTSENAIQRAAHASLQGRRQRAWRWADSQL